MGPTEIVVRWIDDAILFLPSLVLIAVLLGLTIVMSRSAQRAVRRLSRRTAAPPEIGELLGRMARISILIAGILLVLQRIGWGETVLSFIAGLGIAGLVIGFALQDIVKQFAAGVLLLMLRPFSVGDQVRIAAFEGTVIAVQLRVTVLKTVAGDEVQIPNADVYTTPIVNMSRYDMRRRTIAFSLPGTTDLEQARRALASAVTRVPGVAADPAPAVVATSFDESTLKVELRFWVDERTSSPDAVATEVVAAAGQALREGWKGQDS